MLPWAFFHHFGAYKILCIQHGSEGLIGWIKIQIDGTTKIDEFDEHFIAAIAQSIEVHVTMLNIYFLTKNPYNYECSSTHFLISKKLSGLISA